MLRYTGIIALAVFALAASYFLLVSPVQPPEVKDGPARSDAAVSRGTNRQSSAKFDFYVLSLSWSPSFCASNAGRGNQQQCGTDRRLGFVVHGLWPQYDSGYPEFCDSRQPQRVSENIGRALFDIMPSMGLIGHQWRKHGTCSGLDQKAYFDLTRRAYNAITIPRALTELKTPITLSPDDIERRFIASNPGLSAQSIAVTCQRNQIEEVRICMNSDLGFRPCPQVDRKSCRARSITIPAISPLTH